MTNKGSISDEDREYFRSQIGDIKRINDDRVDLKTTQPPVPRKRLYENIHQQVSYRTDQFSDHFQHPDTDDSVESGDSLFFARHGIQRKTIRKLKRGQLRCQQTLDLHGMTIAEARQVLSEFIDLCQTERIKNICVIHGKGFRSSGMQPVLKNRVNNWLRQHDTVMAFCSARPADGGTGALYVLLRSR